MKLQNLLFPEAGICSDISLYMHAGGGTVFLEHAKVLIFQKYTECSFNTYFNGFTIEKWLKYTNIARVSLVVKLKGDFTITLLQQEKINNDIIEKIISVNHSFSEQITEVKIPFNTIEPKGIFSFRLKALSEQAEYYGGWYEGSIDETKIRNVYLAMDICTFRREAFIEKNLEVLNDKILKNREHEMYDHLQVFISDNGQTLNAHILETEKVHIFKNKNVGGAGGFTRGLIEIKKYLANYPASHVLLMDDDVVFEIESLYRTYKFLCCLKEEYKDLGIGGAMLRLDKQRIQHEACAVWNGDIVRLKRGLDLGEIGACLYNEIEEYADYGSWWYYCMPLSIAHDQNLPLPIFIKGDDVEYSFRNGTFITLNGICVWHESFDNKYSSFQSYYWIRNKLYCNAMHCPGYTKKRFLKQLYREVLHELMYYRYRNAELLLRGVEDFYKGIEFLEKNDGEKLHKDIVASGYKLIPVEQANMNFNYAQYNNSLREIEPKGRRRWRLLTFNGLLLSANRDTIVPMIRCRPLNFYRAKRALQYDVTSKKAFVVDRSRKETLRLLIKLLKLTFKTISVYDANMKKFRHDACRVTNIVFWKRYLGIN